MPVLNAVADLEKHGVKPSHPRLQIYAFLEKNRIHPTVDEIFSRLLPENPTLSRTTVYNTVKLFVEKGVVDPVLIEDNEVRYDIDRSFHGHFKCDACGRVYDIFPGPVSINLKVPEGFQVKHKHLYYRGLCKDCN